jgi:ribosomal protein S18 acetylase RimI-like enzyme
MSDISLEQNGFNTDSHPEVSQPSLEVRDMEIDDLADVFHLGEKLFTSELYPYIYRTWDQWEVIGTFNTDPEYSLVATIDNQLAGFILGTIINKGGLIHGYIMWLGVSPNFQRRGVADMLVDKLVERMINDGARLMMVDTDPENLPAVKFFNRKGFSNLRRHIFLSMNLSDHEYYGRLIAYEREKAERTGWWSRPRRRPS